jgi:glycosyltransferase involved in cell wall biosynthesis
VQITALVESAAHVCCRYRLAALRPYLETAGHSLTLQPWPGSAWGWLALTRSLGAADGVILQRKLLPRWQLYLLRRVARILIFDFDDAVFLRDSYAAKGLYSRKRRQRFRRLVCAADVVAAGNSFLRDQAARWAAPGRVHVVPTCVNPDDYPLAAHARPAGTAQLVWIGSSSTLQGLERMQPLLEAVGRDCPGVSLNLICDHFLSLRHLPVLPCPWSEAREGAELSAADVGISWVPDDLWSRGKCGLKVLQYMAAGLPVVANPVGVQAEMVRHGETGFLAETADQWTGAIRRLAHNPELRRRMGRAGQRLVESTYSTVVAAGRWCALLERLNEPPQRGECSPHAPREDCTLGQRRKTA